MARRDKRTGTGTHEFTVGADDVHDGIGEVIIDNDWDWLTFDVDNTDAQALDQFEVQAKVLSTSDFATLSTGWGTPNAHQFANTNLAALAATTKGSGRIRVTGLYSIQFVGSSATAASDTVIDWCLTRETDQR
tara:strand:+ start:586 stop:984 length:399 start_codon:yes stop_codon:yes gene_type:complete